MTPEQRKRALTECATYLAIIVMSFFLITWGIL